MLTARIWVCYVNNVLCAYFTWSQLDMLANARNAINRTCWLHDLPCTPHECANCLLTHSPIIVLAKRPPNRIIIMMKKREIIFTQDKVYIFKVLTRDAGPLRIFYSALLKIKFKLAWAPPDWLIYSILNFDTAQRNFGFCPVNVMQSISCSKRKLKNKQKMPSVSFYFFTHNFSALCLVAVFFFNLRWRCKRTEKKRDRLQK